MLRLLCLAHDLTCQDINPWDPTERPSKTVEASDTWSTIFCQTEMSCCFVRCPWEEKLLYLLISCDTTYISSLEFYLSLHTNIIHIYKDKKCIIIPSKYPCITRSYDRPFETVLRWLSHTWHIKTYLNIQTLSITLGGFVTNLLRKIRQQVSTILQAQEN